MSSKIFPVAVVILVIVVGAASFELSGLLLHPPNGPTSTSSTSGVCPNILGDTTVLKTRVSPVTIGAITEYPLPAPTRWANAIVAAPDGSVWFGEQATPGLGHLYPSNGTLVEYRWPGAYRVSQGSSCDTLSSIWGIALWNGSVWATDEANNALEGLDPATGATVELPVPVNNSFPYTMTAGPDGNLWFTMVTLKSRLGVATPDGSVSVYSVLNHKTESPAQILFLNSTFAYYAGLNPRNQTDSGLYWFNPQQVSGGIASQRVGGNFSLIEPDSVAVSGKTVWLAQHAISMVVAYNYTSGLWTEYPTSLFNFTGTATTLPYFVSSLGGPVWFNEHQGNEIAKLNPRAGTLSEYAESSTPIPSLGQIQNDLTIFQTQAGLWFTSATGNYIGFASATYQAPFGISVDGPNTLTIARGQQATVGFTVNGTWTGSLVVNSSDTENSVAFPQLITVTPSTTALKPGQGSLQVTISAAESLAPGRYTVGVTVERGTLRQTAYLFLTVK
jgi:streptogramin lyase